jgi:hypothetical protein
MMLLLVAMFCVLCAYYRAYSDLRRNENKIELIRLEDEQRGLASMVKHHTNVSPQRVAELAKVNADIAAKKRAIGGK